MVIVSPDLYPGAGPEERRAQKELGAFYSPNSLVLPIVDWAIREKTDRVLDPSCGEGVFLEAAVRRLSSLGASRQSAVRQVRGLDLNGEAIAATRKSLGFKSRLRVADFFSVTPGSFSTGGWVDAVIGNPPYIRYQKFAGAARLQALLRAEEAGARLSSLCSSWAPFVAHAITFLKDGGRLGLILPAELIHASYARPLQHLLRERFQDVVVISFREPVFPGVQEEVVVLLASGRGSSGSGRLQLVAATSAGDLSDLSDLLREAEVFAAGEEPRKWIPGCSTGQGAEALENLRARGLMTKLHAIGKAGIGFVSGANDFFVLRPSEAKLRKIPNRSLVPCVIKARQLPGIRLRTSDVTDLEKADEKCLLWLPPEPLGARERAYEAQGRDLGISERYKCRVRTPWYRVPGVHAPHAFLTYMSDAFPRLCLNEAGVAAANTLLLVNLPAVPEDLRPAFMVAFHNSATLLSCELTGRSYGGGVLKLEPREADRLLVPEIALAQRLKDDLRSLLEPVDAAIRSGRSAELDRAVQTIDEVVLIQGCGLSRQDVEEMRAIGADLRARRRSRKSGRRAAAADDPGGLLFMAIDPAQGPVQLEVDGSQPRATPLASVMQ